MKIAFILGQFPTLSQTFIINQITGLIDLGHDVDIYAVKFSVDGTSKVHSDVLAYQLLERTYYTPTMPINRTWRKIKGLGLLFVIFWKAPSVFLRALSVGKGGRGVLNLIYRAIPFLPRPTYDVIHSHFGPNGLLAFRLKQCGLIPAPIITTFHGFDVNAEPLRSGSDMYQELFREEAVYTVNSSFTMRKVVSLGCPEKQVHKLPVGFNPATYPFKERTLRPGEPVKIITVARLGEKKGIEYSIRAVSIVAKRYPQVQYQIVGEGPLRGTLEQLIEALDLSRNVRLLGWKTQDEVRDLYAGAHMFILSSVTASNGDMEGQGLVLQEAQAMGLPVVSTLHNGIPEGVLDGQSGYLVPERDVDALAAKLIYLIEHPELWPAMGLAGRKFVEQNYDIKQLNMELVKLYHHAITKDMERS
jgi:colanic acid/amylovoran biosynthesis glycosyltransferase